MLSSLGMCTVYAIFSNFPSTLQAIQVTALANILSMVQQFATLIVSTILWPWRDTNRKDAVNYVTIRMRENKIQTCSHLQADLLITQLSSVLYIHF